MGYMALLITRFPNEIYYINEPELKHYTAYKILYHEIDRGFIDSIAHLKI